MRKKQKNHIVMLTTLIFSSLLLSEGFSAANQEADGWVEVSLEDAKGTLPCLSTQPLSAIALDSVQEAHELSLKEVQLHILSDPRITFSKQIRDCLDAFDLEVRSQYERRKANEAKNLSYFQYIKKIVGRSMSYAGDFIRCQQITLDSEDESKIKLFFEKLMPIKISIEGIDQTSIWNGFLRGSGALLRTCGEKFEPEPITLVKTIADIRKLTNKKEITESIFLETVKTVLLKKAEEKKEICIGPYIITENFSEHIERTIKDAQILIKLRFDILS